MGTPFFCMQLSGVGLIGSKVLKKTSETAMCSLVAAILPVGHRVQLKNSSGLAYPTSPPPVISMSEI